MKRSILLCTLAAGLVLAACNPAPKDGSIARGKASPALEKAFPEFLQAMKDRKLELHSIQVIQHDKVLKEEYILPADSAHVMFSVSKTFTATAVGFAIQEGLLSLDDRIVDLFPDQVPEDANDYLKQVTIRHLLTMNVGHAVDPTGAVSRDRSGMDWVGLFMRQPFVYEPGSCYCYNSIASYVLSAAVQLKTGQKVVDYLDTRLWQKLGVEKPYWQDSPMGVSLGGWGLYLVPDVMARMGLCLLHDGYYNGQQIIPADWVHEMMRWQSNSAPSNMNEKQAEERGLVAAESDYMQGYGYQMWMCRHGFVRADGAMGQLILINKEKDAIIVTTSNVPIIQNEMDVIWEYLLPALD